MKNYIKFSFFLMLCANAHDIFSFELGISSFFLPRSQSTDAARDLVGWHRFMHQADTDTWYGASQATLEYTRSFRQHRIADYFFGDSIFDVTGSQAENRNDQDWLADYFGLSPEFASVIDVRPVLQNVVADLGFFAGYHRWYFKLHVPLAWTRTTMDMDEVIEDTGETVPFPADYMATEEVEAPYTSFRSALLGTHSFGDVEALKFGKVACGALSKGGVSDIHATLGYNVVQTENGHAGFNFRVSAPTGNRPTSEFLFTPVIGNGKHWEAGVGFSGSVIIWEKDGIQRADFFFDANVTHLFRTQQQRSFDLLGNDFASRYVLLKEFDSDGTYTGRTLPAINVTTLCCDVEIAAQVDFVIMFGYQHSGFNFDIGYNGWVRSKEKLCCKEDPFKDAHFGVKGIQNVDGANINATQHAATIAGNPFDDQALVMDPNSPVFISPNSLNLVSGAAPMQLTNTLFWHFNYTWHTDEPTRTQPFFGIGGKTEFEGVRPKQALPNKNSLSQWGVWLKGGIAY